MRLWDRRSCISLARLIALSLLLCVPSGGAAAGQAARFPTEKGAEDTLVRVNFTTEAPAPGDTITVNGKRLDGYQPKIIQVFPSTGVVIDDEGNVLTFLGYRWMDIPTRESHVEIVAGGGMALPGRIIGIDESVGVAVVRSQGAKLRKTPLCNDCQVRDGSMVMAPVFEPGPSQFARARILSFGRNIGLSGRGEWIMTMSTRLSGIGEPLMDTAHRVLGFVAGQRPSREDPAGIRTVVYPMPQLLSSAEKILRAGGDIRTGWLGVFLHDGPAAPGNGIVVRSVEEDSPAQRAGLTAEDNLLTWNGKEITDVRRFIQMVQDTEIGSKVAVEVLRQGRQMTVYPVIEPRRQRAPAARSVFSLPDVIAFQSAGIISEPEPLPRSWLGVTAVPLSPELADGLRIPGQKGLLVLNVAPRTPFSQAGVLVGDVILGTDDARIGDIKDLLSLVQSRSPKGRMVLRLLRKGAERSTTVQLPLQGRADERR